MFYFGTHYYPAGLSISDSNLKLAQLKRIGGGIRIQALNRIKLPSGVVEEGEVKDTDKFLSYLKKLNASPLYGQLRGDKIAASLPDTKTFVKRLKISKSLNNLEESIENEMEKHIPFLLEKIYYDWRIIKEEKDAYSVLVGACPQKVSDNYYSALSQAGFSVEALESEAVAICRSTLGDKEEDDSSCLIIDLGDSKTTFIVYADDSIIFTTDIERSQQDIVDEISKKLNISRSKAEKIRDKYQKGGKSKSNVEVDKIINNVFWDINRKINEVFGYYNNQIKSKGGIEKIKLVGKGAYFQEIDSLISSSEAGIETADSLVNLDVDKKSMRQERGKSGVSVYDHCLDFAASIGTALIKAF